MKRTYIQTNDLKDLSIMDIAHLASTIFFTSTLIFSAYLMSEGFNKGGFIALALGSIYFVAANTVNFRWLYAGTWLTVFGLAMKGVMGF
jgi:hypothetical protein